MLLIVVDVAYRIVRRPLARLTCLFKGHDWRQRWQWLDLKTCTRCGKNEAP